MKLMLAFGANGAIDGDGGDDIAPFVITGRFDVATNAAYRTKAFQNDPRRFVVCRSEDPGGLLSVWERAGGTAPLDWFPVH
jgi:hypothetical protein